MAGLITTSRKYPFVVDVTTVVKNRNMYSPLCGKAADGRMTNPCEFKCYYDKANKRCGTCLRTLEQIRDAHARFKMREQERCEEKLFTGEEA